MEECRRDERAQCQRSMWKRARREGKKNRREANKDTRRRREEIRRKKRMPLADLRAQPQLAAAPD